MRIPPPGRQPWRPNATGLKHAVAAGHQLSAQAGLQILEAGGNAVDAGVAACLVTCVVESQMTGIAGIAPMVFRMAATLNAWEPAKAGLVEISSMSRRLR